MSLREVKVEHFRNLVAVSVADGFLDEDKKGFLEERAEEFELPRSKVSEIIKKEDNL